jgi:O-antigen/teichoic acid export membrane protein
MMQIIQQKRLSENAILNSIRILLNSLFPIIIFRYATGILGPDKIGRVEYVNSIVSYFILFSLLGIPAYGLREIARSRNNLLERSRVIFELSIIPLILVCISYVIYFLLINQIESLKKDYLLYLVLSPNIFLSVFNFEWFYQGMEEQRYITFRYLIIKIIQLGLMFFLVRTNSDYIKYALVMFGLNGFANVFNIIYLRKFIIFVPRASINIKRHIRFIFTLASSTVVSMVSSQFNVTMLGIFSGNVYVGYYIAGTKPIRVFLSLFMGIFSVIIPRIEYHKNNGNIDEYDKLVSVANSGIMILLIPISMGLFKFSKDIIFFLAGNQFEESVLLLKVMSCFLLVDVMSHILVSFYMFPNRYENKFAICIFVVSIVNIGLNIILIPTFAHIGAIIATIVSNTVGLIMQLIFLRKYFRLSMLFNKETLKYFISGIIMLLTLFLVPFNFNNYLLNIIVGICVGAFIYAFLLTLLKSSLIFSLLYKYKIIRKKN